jgi:hypothetical protein
LVLGLSSLLLLQQDRSAAQSVDQSFSQGESDQPGNCRNIIRTVSLSKRVMTEKESQTLRVVVANRDGVGICETAVRLISPDFEVAPAATERLVALEPGGDPVTLLWILKPKETGSFEIVLTAGDQTQVLGIVVTNVLGFTAVQVQLLSYLSTFLGPMLTAPWWYERWEKRQKAKKEAEEKALKDAREKAKQGNQTAQTFRPE